jgi:hypothetical protein
MLVHSELVNGIGKLTEATRFRQAQAGDCDALNGLREPTPSANHLLGPWFLHPSGNWMICAALLRKRLLAESFGTVGREILDSR